MKFLGKNIIVIFLALCVIGVAAFVIYDPVQTKVNYTADIVIQNAKILTLDDQSHIYNNGYIVIKDSKIIALGEGRPPKNFVAKKIINAQGLLAMPGLVNTHSHSPEVLERGLDDSEPLEAWLKTLSEQELKFTPEDIYWGSLLASDEMLRSGTTVFNDMFFEPAQTAKAANLAGIRGVLRIPTVQKDGQIIFQDDIVKQFENNPLIIFSVDPNPLLNYSVAELKQFSDYALAKNFIVHIHFEEDETARKDALDKYHLTPTELIEQSGLLRNKLVLAHAADVTSNELDLLAKHPNLGVSFNPKSEAKLNTPLTPVWNFLSRGIAVGFGTDGGASSNSLDIFGQINFAAYGNLKCSGKEQFCPNGYSVDSQKIIRMATIDGAKILGLDGYIGSIESGKQADIILINLQQPHLTPSYDIYSTLVYNTSGSDVVDTIVAGKLVMENGNILTIDEQQLFKQIKNITEKLKK